MVYYFKFLSSITIYSWNFLEQGQENQEELALNNCAHVEHTEQGYNVNEGVVSKETVVLRRWGSSIQKFGFINGVDNVNWPPYRDSKS